MGTLMIDAIHANVGNIPVRTPKVGGYVTGTPDIKWTPSDWARFPHAGIQYRRSRSPIGVPGPTRVRISLSSLDNTANLPRAVLCSPATVSRRPGARQPRETPMSRGER